MKYQHAQIQVEQPAPGHYSVSGIPAHTVFVENVGHVVAPDTLYISPSVPDELLETILADRRAQRELDGGNPVSQVPAADESAPVDHSDPEQNRKFSEVGNRLPPATATPKRRGRPAKKPHAIS